MVGNVQEVLALDRPGIEVVSVREPWLDMGRPSGPSSGAILSWVAEEERGRSLRGRSSGWRGPVGRGRESGAEKTARHRASGPAEEFRARNGCRTVGIGSPGPSISATIGT